VVTERVGCGKETGAVKHGGEKRVERDGVGEGAVDAEAVDAEAGNEEAGNEEAGNEEGNEAEGNEVEGNERDEAEEEEKGKEEKEKIERGSKVGTTESSSLRGVESEDSGQATHSLPPLAPTDCRSSPKASRASEKEGGNE